MKVWMDRVGILDLIIMDREKKLTEGWSSVYDNIFRSIIEQAALPLDSLWCRGNSVMQSMWPIYHMTKNFDRGKF